MPNELLHGVSTDFSQRLDELDDLRIANPLPGVPHESETDNITALESLRAHELLRDSEFSFNDTTGIEIHFVGTMRVEIDKANPAKSRVLDLLDPARNFRSDVLEVATAVNDIRKAMFAGLLERFPEQRPNYEYMLEGTAFFDTFNIRGLEYSIECSGQSYADPGYTKLSEQLEKGEEFLERLINQRNTSPDLIRRIAAERAERLPEAIRTLSGENKPLAIFDVEGVGWQVGGVVGRGFLLAEGLLNKLPNLHVHMNSDGGTFTAAGVTFGRSTQDRLTMGQGTMLAPDSQEPILKVGIWGGLGGTSTSGAVNCDFRPLCYVIDSRAPSREYLAAPTNNDLKDPYGTLILDGRMRADREMKDQWSLPELARARRDWLEKVGSREQNAALNELSKREGWNPEHSIWGFAYVQSKSSLLGELRTLMQVSSSTDHGLPVREDGKHILLHLRPGTQCYLNTTDFTSLGIRLIDYEGTIHNPETTLVGALKNAIFPPQGPGVTVVLHQRIPNERCKDMVSLLTGCAVRDSTDSHWIDFPTYITGSGSWLEGISAGAIALHDNNDAGKGKRLQIQCAIAKHIALEDTEGSKTWNDVWSETESRVKDHLLGDSGHADLYRDLEAWSKRSRDFSDAMFRFNSVDDLIIALSDAFTVKRGQAISN